MSRCAVRTYYACLVLSLGALLLATPLLTAGVPPGDWIVESVEYDYGWSEPETRDVIKTLWEKDLGAFVPYTVGTRRWEAGPGSITVTAWCYPNVRPGGGTVECQFNVAGTSGVFTKLNLTPTGPRPGPPPSYWWQQGYCKSEAHHVLTQSAGWELPGPWWEISWWSEVRGGGDRDSMYHFKDWADDNWFGRWGLLEAEGSWLYVMTDWHGLGCVRGEVRMNCTLADGAIRAQVANSVTSKENRHDP